MARGRTPAFTDGTGFTKRLSKEFDTGAIGITGRAVTGCGVVGGGAMGAGGGLAGVGRGAAGAGGAGRACGAGGGGGVIPMILFEFGPDIGAGNACTVCG